MTELSGLAFPFRIENGRVARATGFEKVEEDVIHLLSVRLGERAMRRGYGAGVHGRRQLPNGSALAALVRHEVETALRTSMPDLRLTAPLRVVAGEERLTVEIQYAAAPGDMLRRLEVPLP